jgi:hypothetical protein
MIVIAPIPEILFVYVTRQGEVGLIWHDKKNIKNPFIVIHLIKNCQQKFTWEALSCSFSSWVTGILYKWYLKYSCKTLQRDLLDIRKVNVCGLAEHVQLCCITTLTHSKFSGVWMEHAGPAYLFTMLPWRLTSSNSFKMALCKGIQTSLRTSNSCTIDLVSK